MENSGPLIERKLNVGDTPIFHVDDCGRVSRCGGTFPSLLACQDQVFINMCWVANSGIHLHWPRLHPRRGATPKFYKHFASPMKRRFGLLTFFTKNGWTGVFFLFFLKRPEKWGEWGGWFCLALILRLKNQDVMKAQQFFPLICGDFFKGW